MSPTLPDVYFGALNAADIDWRSIQRDDAADLDDDEQRDPTPPDVIQMLGFDPAAIASDDDED